MIEDVTKRSLEDIRAAYKTYLIGQNLSKHAIMTCLTDAFYIWRKQGADSFWQIIFSDNFETLAKETLLRLLHQLSSGNVESNVHGYLACLRRFSRFIQSEADIEIPDTVLLHTVNVEEKMKATIVQELSAPTIEQVEYYLGQWNYLEDYRLQEEALDQLFFVLCPENKNISDILLKVSVLNDFYSTNIFKVYPVAKRILSLHIDNRLQCGDVTLVDDIKKVVISDRELNFYSFATKYCSHHRPLDYPIYDSYVDEVLRYYRKVDGFASFKNDELKNYVCFKSILEKFRSFYHLEKYNLKELDKYLWQLGKKHFNKYEQRKTPSSQNG
jgi:hypothetical protein